MNFPTTPQVVWPVAPSSAPTYQERISRLTAPQIIGSLLWAAMVFCLTAVSIVFIDGAPGEQGSPVSTFESIGMILTICGAIALGWRSVFPQAMLWAHVGLAVVFGSSPFLAWAALPAALRSTRGHEFARFHRIFSLTLATAITVITLSADARRSTEMRALSTVTSDGAISYVTVAGYVALGIIGVALAYVRSLVGPQSLLEHLAQRLRSRWGTSPVTLGAIGRFFSVPRTANVDVETLSSNAQPAQPFAGFPPPAHPNAHNGAQHGGAAPIQAIPEQNDIANIKPVGTEAPASGPKWAHFGPPSLINEAPNAAREAERERIAMELHDTVAHQLSLAALQASALEVASDTMDIPQSAQAVRGSINKALDEMRTLIWALRDSTDGGYTGVPPTLEDLERLIADASASGAPLDSEIRVEQGHTAHLTLTNAMYRITQEALTNAIRYGVKSSIFIRILGAPGLGISIDVFNEIANPSDVESHGSHNGLGGMEARAQALGGSIHTSTLGNVWLFQAKLPWT